MKKLLNYTSRKDNISKSGKDAEIIIRVIDKDSHSLFSPELNIDEQKNFPKNAQVFIQAYSTDGYVGDPIDFGTIENIKNITIEEPNASPDQIRFRLKIIENNDNSLKKVLGTCYQIRPHAPKKNTLLLFGEGKIDSVYELLMDPNDVPKILFKTGLGLKSDINRSSFLKGIFFTAALREILLRYIVDYEDFIECEVRKDYSQHFKNLINEVLPTQYSNDTENNTHNWINKAIRAFTNHQVKTGVSLIAIMPTNEIKIEEKLTWSNK